VAVRQRPPRGAPGQHFLRSSRLAAELVRDAGIAPGELVVDIGAGSGVLTVALLDAGAHVTALELDSALAAQLRRRFTRSMLTVLEVDARSWSWPHERFSIVSNLPFAGAGEILLSLLRDPETGLRQADVIVQWEFAQKHSAISPATLRSTYWRAWFEVTTVGRLARTAFAPTPNVDAAVLRFERRSEPLVPIEEHERYWRFLDDAFRGQAPLGRALRRWLTPRELRRLAPIHGFDASSRPRDLDARQWAHLLAYAAEHPRSRR
jgi:23S rRNA (adenine-N6)-dimethyltransferase